MIKEVYLYYDSDNVELLYCGFNGNGDFCLNNDGSVHLSDNKDDYITTTFGIPSCKEQEYDIMEIDDKLGLFDSNLNLIKEFNDITDVINNIEGITTDYTLINWD